MFTIENMNKPWCSWLQPVQIACDAAWKQNATAFSLSDICNMQSTQRIDTLDLKQNGRNVQGSVLKQCWTSLTSQALQNSPTECKL